MYKDLPENARKFLDEIIEISKKYGLSLAHEDDHGAFIVDDYRERNINWLMGAERRYAKCYEIWLDDNETHFNRGRAYTSDDRSIDLVVFHNDGTYGPGSVLVTEADDEDYDLYTVRWYPRNGCIEFYMWLEEVDTIIFHNEGTRDIYLYEYAYLKPGETVTITRGNRIHRNTFGNYSAIGMVEMTKAAGFPEMVGQKGLILEGVCREDPSLFYWRFVSVDQLQKPDAAANFDTAPGVRTFEKGGWHLQTTNGEYAYNWIDQRRR